MHPKVDAQQTIGRRFDSGCGRHLLNFCRFTGDKRAYHIGLESTAFGEVCEKVTRSFLQSKEQ